MHGFCVDASDLSFDPQALRRDDALAGALSAVEDRSAAVQGMLSKAEGVLSRIREELAPKAELIKNMDELVESLAGGVPASFKNSLRAAGASMSLAMVQAHGVEIDPAAVSKAMPVSRRWPAGSLCSLRNYLWRVRPAADQYSCEVL